MFGRTLNSLSPPRRRSGVVPYTFRNGKLYLLFGVDRATQELTDFGGGVKNGETSLTGAIREFREESRGVLATRYYMPNMYETSYSLVDRQMSIVFLPMHPTFYDGIPRMFRALGADKRRCDELSDVRWLSMTEFVKIVFDANNKKMWKRVKRFLSNTITDDFTYILTHTYIPK